MGGGVKDLVGGVGHSVNALRSAKQKSSIYKNVVVGSGGGGCVSSSVILYCVLQFTASFEGKYSPVCYTKEIFIGTVPVCRKEMKSCIAGMFNQPYRDSLEFLGPGLTSNTSAVSLTQIIAAASITGPRPDPTAPTLSTLDQLDNGGRITAPSWAYC